MSALCDQDTNKNGLFPIKCHFSMNPYYRA